MVTRNPIHPGKRRALMLCAAMLTLAVAAFATLRSGGIDAFTLIAALGSAVFALCVGLSLYRPIVVIAFLGLLSELGLSLSLIEPVGAPAAQAGVGDVMAATGTALGSVMLMAGLYVALIVLGLVMLLVVLTQRRWGPVVDAAA